MVRILHVENDHGEVTRIPLYPRYSFKGPEGSVIKEEPEIHLSVDDICTAVEFLIEEGAITDRFKPSPNVQRLHKMFKNGEN